MFNSQGVKIFLSGFVIIVFLSVTMPVARAGFWDAVSGQGSWLEGALSDPSSSPPPDRGALDDISGALRSVGSESFGANAVRNVDATEDFFQIAFGRVIGLVFSLSGTIFLIVMIYGGFLWMSAAGNPEQLDNAKNLVTRSIVGMGIVFAAFALVYMVSYIYFRVTSPPHVQTFIAPEQENPF